MNGRTWLHMQIVHAIGWHLGFPDLLHMGSPRFGQALKGVKPIDRWRILFTEILPVVCCSVDCVSLKHTKLHPRACKDAASATRNIHPVLFEPNLGNKPSLYKTASLLTKQSAWQGHCQYLHNLDVVSLEAALSEISTQRLDLEAVAYPERASTRL